MSAVFYGIDVSLYQGSINWTELQPYISFVFIQAAAIYPSGNVQDPNFYTNQAGARQNNIPVGYYCYSDVNSLSVDPVAAANYFIGIINPNGNPMRPGEIAVLDWDSSGGTFNATTADNWCWNFCNEVVTKIAMNNNHMVIYMDSSAALTPLGWAQTNGVAYLWVADPSFTHVTSMTDYSESYPDFSVNTPNYNWIQGPTQTYPGISGSVDSDSFYSSTGLMSAWNSFGRTGSTPPPQGTANPLPDMNVTPTFTQPYQVTLSVPQNTYDRIIFSDTITQNISVSNYSISFTVDTNIGQIAYPVGNFSYDGGVTWQDYGFSFATDLGSFIGNTPSWVVQPSVSPSGTITFNVINVVNQVASATFIFHIALLAIRNDVLSLPTPLPNLPSITQDTAFSNLVPNQSPPYAAYRRIGSYGSYNGGSFSDHDIVFYASGAASHGLGEVPNLLFYQIDTSNDLDTAPSRWSSSGGISGKLGIAMDATNIYLNLDSSTSYVIIRFYLDN